MKQTALRTFDMYRGYIRRSIGVAGMLLMAGGSLHAQATGSAAYTLEECLQIAQTNNLEIQRAESQLRSAGADVTGAFGEFLPSLNYRANYHRLITGGNYYTDNGGQPVQIEEELVKRNNYGMSVTAGVTLFDGFNRESNYNRAQASLRSTDLNAQYTRLRTLHEVRRQFVEVLRLRQVVSVRREDLELGKQELARVKAQHEVGKLPVANVYSQEAEIGNKELQLVQAENELNIARASLLATMGRNPAEEARFIDADIPTEIAPEDIATFRTEVGTYNSAFHSTLRNRRDLASSEKGLEAAEESVTMAQSGYFPNVSANGGWQWDGNEFANFSELGRTFVNLSIEVPIFNNFQTNRQIQSAKVEQQRYQIEIESKKHELAAELQKAFLQLAASEKELEITERSLKSAELNFFNAGERFKIGAATQLDYQTANNQVINARINRITAVYKYLQAQYLVRFTMGNLDS